MKPFDTGTLSPLTDDEIADLKNVINDLRRGHGDIRYLFSLLWHLIGLLRRRARR